MNTTPDFDEISLTTPLESKSLLRLYAQLRFCVVVVSIMICIPRIFGFEVLPHYWGSFLIMLGMGVGIGVNQEALEPIWRPLKSQAKLVVISSVVIVAVGTALSPGHTVWGGASSLLVLGFLVAIAWGLGKMIYDPLRAARYRQVKRHLRFLPKKDAKSKQRRLMKSFDTLLSEGFY